MPVLARTLALLATVAVWRRVRGQRRVDHFNRRLHALHAEQADAGTTLAHFWLGSLLARHGTDEQMDDWYRLTHGGPDAR